MATLAKKNGVFLARFRFDGKEFKRSLKTSDANHARAALRRIDDVLHWLAIRHIAIPENVDPGDFIVSGGNYLTPAAPAGVVEQPSVDMAVKDYLGNLAHVAETHRYTIGVHLRNLMKMLPQKVQVEQVTRRDLDAYLQARLRTRAATTVRKERDTIVNFFKWLVGQGYVSESPATGLPTIKASGDQSPFRTTKEIEQVIQRGGLSEEETLALWDCLYLTLEEIAGLLDLVKKRSAAAVSFLLHAIPAYTGMRRGEVLRLRWVDIDFEHGSLIARSRKQSRQAVETHRRIELHEELQAILQTWRGKRPRGQHVICEDGCLDALTPRQANKRFWQPLRGTAWCLKSSKNWFKIGFHTYRHSFASNLAAAGVDQRLIDEFMGHTTEAMRRRYRHLFPKSRRQALEKISLRPLTADAVVA